MTVAVLHMSPGLSWLTIAVWLFVLGLIIFRPWPHEGVHKVGAGGSSAREEVATNSVSGSGLTATAGASCTCDPAFYPDAIDADCPAHGLMAFSRTRIFDQERVGA